MAKRIFDLSWATVGVLALSPLLLAIGLWIRLDSPGPVFFRQERVGRFGRPFRIWKFRTMVAGADALGPQITVDRDARVTRAGAVLRRFKLDELPQLFNVLAGEMSFVGPRPEVPRYVARYTEEQRRVLAVRPGITDLASIEFRNESELLSGDSDPERRYVEEIMPRKIAINFQYMARAGVIEDTRIILLTLRKLAAQ